MKKAQKAQIDRQILTLLETQSTTLQGLRKHLQPVDDAILRQRLRHLRRQKKIMFVDQQLRQRRTLRGDRIVVLSNSYFDLASVLFDPQIREILGSV